MILWGHNVLLSNFRFSDIVNVPNTYINISFQSTEKKKIPEDFELKLQHPLQLRPIISLKFDVIEVNLVDENYYFMK